MSTETQPLVLVVEDHPVNQMLAVSQLEQLGCRSIVASSGWEALSAFELHQFDVILMDWQLGDIDGLETTRRMRAREAARDTRRTPVVAVTATTMSGDRERCIDAGMDDFLSKPVSLAELRVAIDRAIAVTGPDGGVMPGPDLIEDEGKNPAIDQLLNELDDASVVVKIMTTFLLELPGRIRRVVDAAAAGDTSEARRIAHTLKSVSEFLGAHELAEVARKIEESTDDDTAHLDRLMQHLPVAGEEAAANIAAVRDELAARSQD